jgi:hypothetical protein
MAYTIGIKRRFGFGWRKVSVSAHDWREGRFILNLTDGSQEYIPGVAMGGLKVYADFWTHIAQLERSKPARQAPLPAPVVEMQPPPREVVDVRREEPEESYVPEPHELQEAKRRAAERVRNILASELS